MRIKIIEFRLGHASGVFYSPLLAWMQHLFYKNTTEFLYVVFILQSRMRLMGFASLYPSTGRRGWAERSAKSGGKTHHSNQTFLLLYFYQ